MSLLKKMEFTDSPFQPYLNTGTLYDVQTGVFVPGTHGGAVLNGGFSNTNGFIGRQQMFKSTVMFSHEMRAMSYYPGSESYTLDTEFSLKKDRQARFSPYHNHADLCSRMVIQTPAFKTAEEFFEDIKKLAAEKLAHRDDYLVESPIIDPRTGKALMMLLPTFVNYDSWSKMFSSNMQTTFDTKTLGSSDTNMVYMRDGNIKKMIMTQLPTLGTRAGIYFMLSAHIGDKYELNPYAPSPKSLQHMRASEKLKEVGSDFNFLVSNTLEMRTVQLLVDGEKECLYPIPGGSDVELSEVTAIMQRGKNNMSGLQLPLVVSQADGVLSDLTNYHYLKKNEYFGLLGNKNTHKPAMSDVSVGRTTIRQKLTDPKVARTIELLAQLCYIQDNWVTTGTEVDFMMKPDLLAEKLLASDGPYLDDVTGSRGWWTYDKKNTQPYLSLYDVLAIAQGTYRAKGVSLAGMTTTKPPVVEKKKAA